MERRDPAEEVSPLPLRVWLRSSAKRSPSKGDLQRLERMASSRSCAPHAPTLSINYARNTTQSSSTPPRRFNSARLRSFPDVLERIVFQPRLLPLAGGRAAECAKARVQDRCGQGRGGPSPDVLRGDKVVVRRVRVRV